MRTIDTSVIEPSTITKQKKVNKVYKNIRFLKECFFSKIENAMPRISVDAVSIQNYPK
jgi:hypothetical protein